MVNNGYNGYFGPTNSYFCRIPSGKRLHNYGKSRFLVGKTTNPMAMFNSELFVYQRVYDM